MKTSYKRAGERRWAFEVDQIRPAQRDDLDGFVVFVTKNRLRDGTKRAKKKVGQSSALDLQGSRKLQLLASIMPDHQ